MKCRPHCLGLAAHRHPPRGGVNRNRHIVWRRFIDLVTPLAGVWIEILLVDGALSFGTVTPLAGVWIEISLCGAPRTGGPVTPHAGCGLKSVAP